jgi:hypothetical protein
VAGELPQHAHNAPLHLFSARPELVDFGGHAYRQHSEKTSALLDQLFKRFSGEGLAMPYTMKDFELDYMKEHLPELTPQQRAEVLQALPPEERLAGLTPEQVRQYLDKLTAGPSAPARSPRRKK